MSKQNYKIIEGEQRTEEWFEARKMKITGSTAKKINQKNYVYELIASYFTERKEKEFNSKHIDRGIELEPEAREEYEKATKQKVHEVAFIENNRLGISPDGVIFGKGKAKNKIKKLIEIKCPDTNNHIRYIISDGIPTEHKEQIVHAFIVVDDLKELDFVSYDKKFLYKPLHILTIRRTDLLTEIQTTKIKYEKFLKKFDSYLEKIYEL